MGDFDGTFFTQRIEQAIRMAIQDGFRLILEDRKFDTAYAAHTCGECGWGTPDTPEKTRTSTWCRRINEEPTRDTRACRAFAPLPKGKVDEEKEDAEI